jgi:uncharacterized protein YbbK (DUF523 family)
MVVLFLTQKVRFSVNCGQNGHQQRIIARKLIISGCSEFGTGLAIDRAQVEIKNSIEGTQMAVTKKSLTTKKVASKPVAPKSSNASSPVAADKMVSALRIQHTKRITALKIGY